MNMQEIFLEMVKDWFSAMVNQAIINQSNKPEELPPDQQEAEKKMLDAIHNFIENSAKIKPEYRAQVKDCIVLKTATEMGWTIGGVR